MKRFAVITVVLLAVVLWLAPPVAAQAVTSILVKASIPTAKIKVDGREFIGSASFLWPVGSKHTLDVFVREDGFQYNDVNTSRHAFSGWSDNTGQLNVGVVTSITITADSKVSVFTANFSVEHLVNVIWYDSVPTAPGQVVGCNAPGNPVPTQFRVGVVYIDGTCYWSNAQLWMTEGAHTLSAFPYPGFVFLGWKANDSSSDAFLRSLTIKGPLTISPRFSSAKRVNFRTDPMGLRLRVDRADVLTTDTEPCAPNNFLPPGAPLTIAPMCIGEFDFVLGSTHVIGAPPWQGDRNGKLWVFKGFSNGLGQDSLYVVPNEVYPTEVLTGQFVRGVSANFISKPSNLRVFVEGSETKSENYFVFAPGTKVRISAPKEQTDAKTRKYVFKRWNNDGPADQEVTVHNDVEKSFIMQADYDMLSQVVIKSSTAGGTVLVDGKVCAIPCAVDRPDGTEVRLSVPESIPMSELHRLEFTGWSDRVTSRERVFKVAGVDSVVLQATFRSTFRLQTALDPPDGGRLRIEPEAKDLFYPADSAVTVTIEDKPGFRFRRWDYDLSGTSRSSTVSMAGPRTVVARFDKVPYIAPAGIRNLAGTTPEGVVAPGSLISISGSSLAPYYEAGPTGPILAQALAGVSVLVGDRILPLLSVSPEQIVSQLPRGLAPGEYELRVLRVGQSDITGKFTVVASAPGLFSRAVDTQEFARAFHEDGSEITTEKPARRGERISFAGTGFGRYTLNQPEGFAVPSAPPFPVLLPVEARLADMAPEVLWAGGTPGQVGMDTVRVRLPEEFPEGTVKVLPFKVSADGRESNIVLLPVE